MVNINNLLKILKLGDCINAEECKNSATTFDANGNISGGNKVDDNKSSVS